MQKLKPTIVLLATGGTIASLGDSLQGNVVATLHGEDVLKNAGRGTLDNINIEVENFCTKNSVNLLPQEMIELAKKVREILRRDSVTGAVITHGTSLMEETAFVLDLLVDSDKPVVLTGSQLNASHPWSDGPGNLNDAILVAADPEAAGRGTMIVFSGKIHPGRYAIKRSTCALDAFDPGEKGLLGNIYFGHVTFFNAPQRMPLKLEQVHPVSIPIIPFYSGASADYLYYALQRKEAGVIIEGVGLGNVNGDYYAAIQALRAKNIPVIITTRSPSGKIIPVYAYDGGAASLTKLGVIFSSLPSAKARLLLILLLGGGCSPQDFLGYFD